MSRPILCLDFDGVLHSYTSGWKGADIIPDPPVPGAMKFLLEAVQSFKVHIFSSRSHQLNGIQAMQTWLYKHMREELDDKYAAAFSQQGVYWPKEKPPAMVTIDDRAITFTGIWPTMKALKEFKPWNK